MDRTILVQGHASIEGAGSAEQVQRGLAVVALAGAVDVGLGQHQEAGAVLVPLQLDLVTLEEGLLRNGVGEQRDVEDFDGGGLALGICMLVGYLAVWSMSAHLALGNKDCDGMVLAAGGEGKVSSPLDSELVPDLDEVVALVELHLVGDEASAVLLISRVLEIPASLLLLDEAAEGLLVGGRDAFLYDTPDLEVLGRIAVLILGRALPCDDKGATRREAELVDVLDGEGEDLRAGRGVDYGDGLGGGPAEEAATGRVGTAPEVALGPGEPSERLVDGRSVKDADGLLGPEGKLQRRRHG